jgi:methyl-galactoside transport system ATP-binding protein/inositol transport system ATP-binding protein
MNDEYILEMKNIVKTFPGVHALRGVDFKVKKGEIHALIGENGAGKSTLMKCLIGLQPLTSGDIKFDGQMISHYTTAEALKMGLAMIPQELSPVLMRPIMENVWLGREPLNRFHLVDHKKMYDMTVHELEKIGMTDDPKTLMMDLTVAKIQMVEIVKAVSYDAKLIIMDEPTSALTNKEIKELFGIIRNLKSEGRSVIFISHKLDEVYEITDRISVYRDGEYIGTEDTNKIPMDKLINMMVGRSVDQQFPKIPCKMGEVRLEVKNLSHATLFKDVSFTVRRGEILGIAGLVGAGRSEVAEAIFGVRQKVSGEIFIDGKQVEIKSPEAAIKNKMAFLTEDRLLSGIFPMLAVDLNMTIAGIAQFISKYHLLDEKSMETIASEYVDKVQVKTTGLDQRIENLSGGNQQKVLVARWLITSPEILFVDEPTRGIDVKTKAEIHRLLSLLAGEGKAVVMISSELPEIMGMSDRIMVMHMGKITGIVDNRPDLTQEELMAYATGTVKQYNSLREQSKNE